MKFILSQAHYEAEQNAVREWSFDEYDDYEQAEKKFIALNAKFPEWAIYLWVNTFPQDQMAGGNILLTANAYQKEYNKVID